MLIGAVADDVTGATDLCLMLSRAGLDTVQLMGVPDGGAALPKADAVVIAMKSRTIPADTAVAMSVAAVAALLAAGAEQILFKYCSTFDSTDAGNIGPVAAALMALTGSAFTIACPAFPENGRTVYKGHLFVGDQLLSDSPMRDHPLTPMRDADLVRVLGRQVTQTVGLIDSTTVAAGPAAVRHAFAQAQGAGHRMAVVDTLTDADLMTIGAACAGMRLVTGGSGIARGLAATFVAAGRVAARPPAALRAPPGRAVILAGSCSAATRGQIAAAKAAGLPAMAVDAARVAAGTQTPDDLATWAEAQTGPLPPLIHSSADPQALAVIQAQLGRDAAGALVERLMADTARGLMARGFSRFLVAGGETAGAVVAALGVRALAIGPEIDPGVPWTRSIDGPDLALALKSGNFGAPDFFVRAWSLLDANTAP